MSSKINFIDQFKKDISKYLPSSMVDIYNHPDIENMDNIDIVTDENSEIATDEKDCFRICVYTDINRYTIVCTSDGYLGCTASSRKPRAGEDWPRGNDLPDGEYGHETWFEIIRAILSYEMVRVQKQKENSTYGVETGVPENNHLQDK